MAKNNALVFIEGAVAGVAIGVAASMFLSSKKGKELKNDISKIAGDFYKNISPQLKKAGKMSKKEYEDFMDQAVQKYATAKKMSKDILGKLSKEVKNSWEHFSENMEN